MPLSPKIPAGPIPGENYTSDTKNYPWHRPPEITDLDSGIEASIKQLTTKNSSYALLTMLQAGVTVVQAAGIFVTSGIAEGKWTPDFALLLSGPVSHMMKLMAEGYGIKYDMGLEDEPPSTIEFLKAKAKIDPKKAVTVADGVANQADLFKAEALKSSNEMAGHNQVGLMGSPDPNVPPNLQGVSNPSAPQQPPAQPGQAQQGPSVGAAKLMTGMMGMGGFRGDQPQAPSALPPQQ